MDVKEEIRSFVISTLEVDDVGFASTAHYHSPKSPPLESIFPGAQSLIIMANREPSHCESSNPQITANGRLEMLDFAHHCNLQLARFLEKRFKARAMAIPASYPLNFGPPGKGMIGEVSLRHAAVAAGLGRFGRHNLVIHPRLGSRVLFAGVITNLEIPPDPMFKEDLCTQCNICVESCPVQALEVENQTDVGRCLLNSQPYGLPKLVQFWRRFVDAAPEEQKKMLVSEDFARTYHAQLVGFEYHCFKCYASCPLGE